MSFVPFLYLFIGIILTVVHVVQSKFTVKILKENFAYTEISLDMKSNYDHFNMSPFLVLFLNLRVMHHINILFFVKHISFLNYISTSLEQ